MVLKWKVNGNKIGGRKVMMTIDEMRATRERLHYTYEMLSEKSGVPLATIQKVFSGTTKRPHFKTMEALEAALKRADKSRYEVYTDILGNEVVQVRESGLAYDLYGTGALETTDMTDAFGGKFEISEEGLPIHPRYKIPIRKQGDYTTDDLDKIPDEIRVELIDGVIYDLASPTSIHQVIAATVHTIMSNYAIEHGLHCMPYIAPLDVEFDNRKKDRLQPDLLVMCEKARKEGEPEPDHDAPDFVMEVMSPSSRRMDMLIKLNRYLRAGVKEYWIVDPEKKTVMVYDFVNNDLAHFYSFDDEIPVAISGGDLTIDFKVVQERLDAAERIERSKGWILRR